MDASHKSVCFPYKWRLRKKVPKVAKQTVKIQVDDGLSTQAIGVTMRTIVNLRTMANLVPIPLVKEILGIGLGVISISERSNTQRESISRLRDRIVEFLCVIAEIAIEPGEKSYLKLSQETIDELNGFRDCLFSIHARLEKMSYQSAILRALLPQANAEIIARCSKELDEHIARFQILQSIRTTMDLKKIQQQIEEVSAQLTVDVRNREATMASMSLGLGGPFARMPQPPHHFFGRKMVVEKIANHLVNMTSPQICILGTGGIGKTSTALAILDHPSVKEKFAESNRFWVPCVNADSPNVFLAILSKQLGVAAQTENLCRAISNILEETLDPRVILLDNFETPWLSTEGSQKAVKETLEMLKRLSHVAIIITMRSEFAPRSGWICERLDPVNPDDSRNIYTSIDPSAEADPELNDLSRSLGYLPLAIALMAAHGKHTLLSPKELLKEWREEGTTMLLEIEDSIRSSLESKLVTDSPDAIHLLQILSILPAGVYSDDLGIWVNSNQPKLLDVLKTAALVVSSTIETGSTNKTHILVPLIIQSYLTSHDLISHEVRHDVRQACFKFLEKHASIFYDSSHSQFKNDFAVIALQAANIQSLLTEAIKDFESGSRVQSTELVGGFLPYMWYQYWAMNPTGQGTKEDGEVSNTHQNAEGTDITPKTDHFIRLLVIIDALEIYQTLVMLPAGVCHADLGIWTNSWKPKALDALCSMTLVLNSEIGSEGTKELHLRVPLIFQSYMNSNNYISKSAHHSVYQACYEFLGKHNSVIDGPKHPNFKDDITAIERQEINVRILLSAISSDTPTIVEPPSGVPRQQKQLDAFLTFIWYQRWTRPRLDLSERILVIFKNTADLPVRYKAQALFCHATLLCQFNRYQDANSHFQLAGELFEAAGGNVEALISELNAIEALMLLGEKSQKLLELWSQSSSRWERQYPSDEIAALLSLSRGVIYWYSQDKRKALETLREADELLLASNRLLETSQCRYTISKCLASMRQFEDAIKDVGEAIRLLDVLGLGGSTLAVEYNLIRIRILKGCDNWDESLHEAIGKALEQARKFETPLLIADALDELAEVYVRREDWAYAREAYNDAFKECQKVSSKRSRYVAACCQHNLKYVQAKEARRDDAPNFWVPFRY